MRNYLIKKKSRIIDAFYNKSHNHKYINKYYGYNRDLYHVFKCTNCNHEIEIVFIKYEKDEYAMDFLLDGYCCEYHFDKLRFYICYIGKKALFSIEDNININNEILSCNECIIKNIIE